MLDVDVVIATNRDGRFLDEAIASVEAQQDVTPGIVLVDDGSPDPAALDAVAARHPVVRIVHQAPKGLPAARNVGMRHSGATWVGFLDDDDLWHPDRLRRQLAALAEHPAARAASCGGWYMDSTGRTIGEGWGAPPASRTELLRGAVPIPRIVTLLAHRETCLAIGGFDESFTLGEDNEFILRLLRHTEIVTVDEQLVGYRRHTSNMTNARWRDRWSSGRKVIRTAITAAHAEGDAEGERLLYENLARFHRREARAGGELIPRLLVTRRFGEAAARTSGGLSTAPTSFIAGLGSTTGRIARRAARRG